MISYDLCQNEQHGKKVCQSSELILLLIGPAVSLGKMPNAEK
jgi:hypothetical protein